MCAVAVCKVAVLALFFIGWGQRKFGILMLGIPLIAGCTNTTGTLNSELKSGRSSGNTTISTYAPATRPVQTQNTWPRLVDAKRGLWAEHSKVSVGCLKPELVSLLNRIERKFGKKPIINSGYRSPAYNRRVRGAKRSKHMACEAADISIPGVSKWTLAKYVRGMPGRGGVGTYCRSGFVHVDIGIKRDWNWGCRRRLKKKA